MQRCRPDRRFFQGAVQGAITDDFADATSPSTHHRRFHTQVLSDCRFYIAHGGRIKQRPARLGGPHSEKQALLILASGSVGHTPVTDQMLYGGSVTITKYANLLLRTFASMVALYLNVVLFR